MSRPVGKEDSIFELKSAITIVEMIIAVLLVLLVGDYLGYKVGRWRLAAIVGGMALMSVIAYAIYSAVMLA